MSLRRRKTFYFSLSEKRGGGTERLFIVRLQDGQLRAAFLSPLLPLYKFTAGEVGAFTVQILPSYCGLPLSRNMPDKSMAAMSNKLASTLATLCLFFFNPAKLYTMYVNEIKASLCFVHNAPCCPVYSWGPPSQAEPGR